MQQLSVKKCTSKEEIIFWEKKKNLIVIMNQKKIKFKDSTDAIPTKKEKKSTQCSNCKQCGHDKISCAQVNA